jgi:hypothetical protein
LAGEEKKQIEAAQTNILRSALSYRSVLLSFYVLTIWVCNFLAKGFFIKCW